MGGSPQQGGLPCRGVSPAGGVSLEGGLPACTEADPPPPPVNRMTNRCKNITLPQTSFAGGKNYLLGVIRGRLQFIIYCISQFDLKDINFTRRYFEIRYNTFCFSTAYMTFRSLKRSSIALEIVKENKLVDNTYFIQKVFLFNLKF